ncbi:MAG TPA: L-threonylcarbamoyladenylate synthase [Flavobacteriales bacterium]|nr:L-threonylcarbamoyladenylate synthase [Flavobacteriales bacterium]
MLLDIHPDNPDARKIITAVEILNEGGIIVYPTDSVYAVGCLLNKSKAIERLEKFKKVKAAKANFSIICSDLSNISDYARNVENKVFKIMKKALPGPYTFILNASSKIPSYFNANKKTVGIRVPDNNIARALVEICNVPLVTTSVHDDEDEMMEYLTDAELIHEKFGNSVDLVINGGIGSLEPSTVIDCTSGSPELIREGKGEIVHLF